MIVTAEYRANYGLIEWAPLPVREAAPEPERGLAPYYIPDQMEPVRHPVTGEMLDSKHKFRQRTRSAGCDEVGNDTAPPRQRERVSKPGEDIKRAIEELRSR